MKKRCLFITGTNTGVGKTFVTASLARHLRDTGTDVGVMKPIESGCKVNPKAQSVFLPSDALTLIKAAGVKDPLSTVNPYSFAEPLSPNITARLGNVTIDINNILEKYKMLTNAHEIVLVEGAGGFLTPLSDELTMADLAQKLALPILIVAESCLGCINSTLLTVEAVSARGLKIAGVILNNPKPPDSADKSYKYNLEEITRFSNIPVLGELSYSEADIAKPLDRAIDTDRLLELLQADKKNTSN